MKTWKLWLHLEEHDDETEEYTEPDEPVSLGLFERRENADAAMSRIEELAAMQGYLNGEPT